MTTLEVWVPAEVAEELERGGVVERRVKDGSEVRERILRRGGWPSLRFSGNVNLSILDLADTPQRVPALRDAFLRWIDGSGMPGGPCALVASGAPDAQGATYAGLSYDLGAPPDLEALQTFLERVNEGALDPYDVG
jgi:hypothetical protein